MLVTALRQAQYAARSVTQLVPWVAGGRQVQAHAGTPSREWVDAGHMRPLVMWGNERSPRAPHIPTLKELYGIVANLP